MTARTVHSAKQTSCVLELPNLISVQLDSFRWFLESGLNELFRDFSPIKDFSGTQFVELLGFTLGEPKWSLEECRDRDMTFEAPIRARVRMGQVNGETQETELYLGDLPLMTDKGTFIINGRERVVVSQLIRSSGVYFENVFDRIFRKGTPTGVWLETYLTNRNIFGAKIIPSEGPWIEIDTASNDVVTVKVGQGKAICVTTLLRALESFEQARAPRFMRLGDAVHRRYLGIPYAAREYVDPDTGELLTEECPAEQVEGYYRTSPQINAQPVMDKETGEIYVMPGQILDQDAIDRMPDAVKDLCVAITTPTSTNEELLNLFGTRVTLENPTIEDLERKWALTEIVSPRNNRVLAKPYQLIDREHARQIAALELESLDVLDVPALITATLDHDSTSNSHEALMDIYKKTRPGDPPSEQAAMELIRSQFYDSRRYDLARVGRYKLNRKLGLNVALDVRTITKEDFISTLEYLIRLTGGVGDIDEIDHLKNKRVRAVGELLQSQLRNGFVRMEKVARERMTQDQEHLVPQAIMAIKPISAAIKSFFGSSQLSQFMDQTNPLSELTHKRRLSALGPGGLTRQSATLEVRDVHDSHYGRICPIETPEGPNIGLISQLATYARVNEFGFIETPYRRVVDGRVTDEVVFLSAEEDEKFRIAPGDTPVDSHGKIKHARVQVRHQLGEDTVYPEVDRTEVDYMDVSPVQLVSIASALIPFLENDDATRALMGSNMQKQAVPLLRSDAPVVKTGFERRALVDSGALVLARRRGTVRQVTCTEITVKTPDGKLDVYPLMSHLQSNQSTCVSQRPIVSPGERVREGQVLADGPCSDHGEMALGKNVLVCFVPWGGYNYEDAILVSQRLVRDDVYSSIHMERYEIEARDTKLGPEEITRDIPNLGEEALKDLDENGIIRIGAQVQPEDLLVGKVQPKGQSELSAEERLIIAIFGKKAEETRDVSLKLPHGEKGKVVDVKVFSRFRFRCKSCGMEIKLSKKPEDAQPECKRCGGNTEKLPPDELSAGVNMLVRVYIAQKRKLMEGDKMAGRHGNKGVISKILPDEDMPFLPDGTPVDIVLNPLGVPSRMNIGQIMETHLGWAGTFFDTCYENPAFQGASEQEILQQLAHMAEATRARVLQQYVRSELMLDLQFHADESTETMLNRLKEHLLTLPLWQIERIARVVNVPAPISPILMDNMGLTSIGWRESVVDESMLPAELREKADPSVIDSIMQQVKHNTWERCGIDERTGKCRVRDGMTGEPFDNPLTVGVIYMLKLAHLVDDKIHARSTGPYSLVTQQPLGGKAQFGGQRFGEMEVWALEAYGASNTLQEMLTIKSDDIHGRVKVYEAIVKGEPMMDPGIPESFKILVKELQSLGLRVSAFDMDQREINWREEDEQDAMRYRRYSFDHEGPREV